MKPKLLVVGAILVALAVVTARNRFVTDTVPVALPAVAKAAPPDVKPHPAFASYRVFEDPAAEGKLPFRGASYQAEVSRAGLRFEAGEHRISLRARRVEQGGASLDLAGGDPVRTRFGATSIPRAEGVAEEFVFENGRAEHLVRLDRPVGEGAVVVRVAVETNLSGQVRQVRMGDASWKDMTLEDGGLVFTDAAGKPALAYHGAVAVDAAGRRQKFDPRWENGEIALEVPASFMKDAAYPVLIDPWLELNFSGTGGGISNTGSVSETPAITLISGASPAVAWSDASDGDFDIYFRYWNGDAWTPLGTSANAGGISNNTGKSTNPSIGFFTPTDTTFYHPFIAWEDDTSGTTNIYAKFWTGTTWAVLSDSATLSGVSLSLGVPCRSPQAVGVTGLIQNDPTKTEPSRQETFPCIVWEKEGVGIQSRFFYPGDNRTPSVDEGWYNHPSGAFVTQNPSAARPSVVVDSTNSLVVAWEQSSGTQFDIFASRAPAGGSYVVNLVANVPVPGVSLGAAVAWAPVGGGNVCTGLPAALSIQPSLAVAPNNDLWVAWQETVAAEREIYVRRSAGGGAWAAVANSSTGGGISSTSVLGALTTSSFPSIAIDPFSAVVQPVVAWEDDSNGNPEIYVRRLNVAGTAWSQVADEGSALLVAPEVTGNAGGVSRTPSFSLRPRAIVAPGGGATVAWRDGAAGTFDLLVRRYHDNTPDSLSQQAVSGVVLTPLAAGATTASTEILFSAVLTAESSTLPTTLRLQLEIRPTTSVFTSQLTRESLEVSSGATATVLFTGLPNVNYHWRARSIDAQGRTSPWISFGGNADGTADFRINSGATGAGPGNTVGDVGNEHKDKCGLAGLEALALVGLAALARRRRKA